MIKSLNKSKEILRKSEIFQEKQHIKDKTNKSPRIFKSNPKSRPFNAKNEINATHIDRSFDKAPPKLESLSRSFTIYHRQSH